MSTRLVRPATAVILAFLSASSARPQQKERPGVVRETARATVIEVPVTVIGKDGRSVAGLTAADFELYDDGKKQEISGFEVADLRRPAAAPDAAPNPFPEAPPAAARRHWFLVFDLSYSSPTGLLRARDGARSFVEKQMAPSDLAGVATLSVEQGWKLVENFTNDRVQLTHAINTLGLIKPGVRTVDPLAFVFESPSQEAGGRRDDSNSDAVKEQIQDLQRLQQTASDERERGRIAQQLRSLGQMARTLDAVRGRKHVLFFSEGFESRILSGDAGKFKSSLDSNAPTQETNAEASIHGETWKIDSDARFGSSATQGFLSNALSFFRRADVVLDTIDISGLRAEADVARRAGSGADALFTMANETTGAFIRNANQLSGDLQQLIDQTALVYLLAYQPKNLSKAGAFHELRVKVNAPASKVSFRSGYYEPRPYRILTPIERVLASGDLLTGGGGAVQLNVQMLAAPFASDAKVAQIPVILEIPGKSLIEGDSSTSSGVQIYAYASDANGTVTDFLTQEMSLDLKQLRSRLEAGGIKYYGTLFLPPGRYTLRSLVRNVATGRSALTVASLTVPVMPGGVPIVLPPFFQDPTGSWLMVKANPRPEASAHPADYPFAVGGDSFVPTALPVLASGATAQVAVVTFNFGAAAQPDSLQVLPEILGPDGKPRKTDVQVVRRSDREGNGARKLLLSFKPEGLQPGRYLLRVRASDRVSRQTAEASTAFEIR